MPWRAQPHPGSAAFSFHSSMFALRGVALLGRWQGEPRAVNKAYLQPETGQGPPAGQKAFLCKLEKKVTVCGQRNLAGPLPLGHAPGSAPVRCPGSQNASSPSTMVPVYTTAAPAT